MLVSFSVENYLSFAKEQTLSLSAGRFRSERIGSTIHSEIRGVPDTLRTLAIMGANGSGKSSLFGAVSLLQHLVENSAQGMQKGEEFPVYSHKLDEKLAELPSRFEIEFVFEDVHYHYILAIRRKHVVRESLMSRKRGSAMAEVFCRTRQDSGEYLWNLGELPVENARLWRESTRENGLFLSTAVQLNSKELAKPYEWIADHLRVFDGTMGLHTGLTSHMIQDHVEDGCRDAIMNLIREADLGVRNILVKEKPVDEDAIPKGLTDEVRRRLLAEMKAESGFETSFVHRTKRGKDILFELDEESEGTQRLFALAGHLIYAQIHDATILYDEVETSLHPLIVRLMVEMFQNPRVDGSSAQLIFSTHDDGLLDSGILERDQFVFIEKRRGASELIPLIDYRPRKGEAIRNNYLRGRYGGIPAISRVKPIELK